MKIIKSVSEMQSFSRKLRKEGKTIGVVPTMGCLHEGHLSLVDMARSRGADAVVVTIFVNPTQFGPGEDFEKYPRNFERDRQLCEAGKADAVFAPSPEEMYPENASTWVTEELLSKGLCGRSRPGHFRGVGTVVAKLFNATLPDMAVFGQKDAQQVAVIKRMARDLNFPLEIIVAPIVREKDGLALSSRNKYLSPDERKRAPSISQALFSASRDIKDGKLNIEEIINRIKNEISASGGKIDYLEAVDADTLQPANKKEGGILLAAAVFFGTTRLIDNVVIE